MDRLLVEATGLRTVGYNARKQDLEIELMDGSLYRYFSVPAKTYLALMESAAKDDYYKKNIQNVFIYSKVE